MIYQRFFGLADEPFRLTPDPRYLFLSPTHADALAHLKLGLTESSGFVCITGDVGTGKTTLLRAYLASLGPEISTAYIFNPALTVLELLRTINGELGLPATSRSRKKLVDALNRHLLAQREAGRRSVVVVDEAQGLSLEVLEELRLLSNLETTTEKLLRIVIVGQPQLRALLVHPSLVQLNQRITLRWHVGPLAAAETAAYVRHRLAIASRGEAGPIFTRPALWLVHRLSGGVPRLINMIAHRAMLAAFASERRSVGMRSVLRAHREIESVPLPPLRPTRRRAAWSAFAAGVVLALVALGVGRTALAPATSPAPDEHAGDARLDVASIAPAADAPPPAADAPPAAEARTPAADAGTPAADAPPAADVAAPPVDTGPGPAVPPADTPPAAQPAETPPPVEAATESPTPPSTAALPELPPVRPSPEPAPPPVPRPSEALERRLAELGTEPSARAAVAAVLEAWHAAPLAPKESVTTPAALDGVARARGLEQMSLVGSASLLRLLDLPAVLELRLPGADGPRYAALLAAHDGEWSLSAGEQPVETDSAFLDRAWFGQARLFWRDHEALGAGIIDRQAKGTAVARLQRLLGRAGLNPGPGTGVYSSVTEAAVLDFQRRHLLLADGRVGPITRIVLYATGGYPAPRLTGGAS